MELEWMKGDVDVGWMTGCMYLFVCFVETHAFKVHITATRVSTLTTAVPIINQNSQSVA